MALILGGWILGRIGVIWTDRMALPRIVVSGGQKHPMHRLKEPNTDVFVDRAAHTGKPEVTATLRNFQLIPGPQGLRKWSGISHLHAETARMQPMTPTKSVRMALHHGPQPAMTRSLVSGPVEVAAAITENASANPGQSLRQHEHPDLPLP
ncbi:MAG: hypothetical protein KGL21_10395, partial [Alphaproteobacteria bacterium]|nr:hypothetical protein [Alphaproteobacteria bacterium]